MSFRKITCLGAAVLLSYGLTSQAQLDFEVTAKQTMALKAITLKIKSVAFEEGGMIPQKYTCHGEDVSPALEWSQVPEEAVTVALIADDPDAPMGTWVHWVLYNLPANITALPEKVPPQKTLENQALQGTNDFGRIGYGGPCPPSGSHRYFFKLYALDAALPLKAGATKKELLKTMEGHILAEGQTMGRFQARG